MLTRRDSIRTDKASTLRTALGYRTLWWKSLAAMIEFENVVNIGFSNDHNNAGAGSLWNGVTDRPVIPDPPLTEINQVYLDWKPLDSLPIRGGRQEIIIDNSRFIGNVGWRQNHQTFDGAAGCISPASKTSSSGYSYIARQRTVTGASRPMSTSHFEGVLHLFGRGRIARIFPVHRLRPGSTVGAVHHDLWRSFTGKSNLSDALGLNYRLEVATQQDTGNNPESVEADYFRADLGFVFGKVTAAAGYEVLGGSAGRRQLQHSAGDPPQVQRLGRQVPGHPCRRTARPLLQRGAKLGRFALSAFTTIFRADSGGARGAPNSTPRSSTPRRGSRSSR